jgi:phosphoglycerate dehydrogenase-like enzyme
MKLRCVILDDYQNVALSMADWSSLSEQVDVQTINRHFESEDELVKAVNQYEIIVIMRERTAFSKSVLLRLPRLKLLVTTGMRNASIDFKTAASQGVIVCGTISNIEPPIELTWALILGLSRNLVLEHSAIRNNGPWQSTVGIDLYGKTLGLLGLGKIGSRVAMIGKAFGMEVVAWSQNLTKERTDGIGVRLAATKEELLAMSDFVSIHLVLSERTKGLIGEEELRMMKPSSYLINTSRAQVVNQEALQKGLQNGWIAGAGVDVYEKEPLPENDVFRTLPNLLTTPHLGYVTERNYHTFFQNALEDIQSFLKGTPIRKVIEH